MAKSDFSGHNAIFQRVHPDGFLPAQLVGVGRSYRPVPADPVDHLHVEQVEVDGMGVHAIMGDLPDLGLHRTVDRSRWADQCTRRGSSSGSVKLVNGSSTPRVAFIRP